MSTKLSKFDKKNIAEIVSGHGDWFSAHLIRLIVKADESNRSLLYEIYPEHVDAVEAWQNPKKRNPAVISPQELREPFTGGLDSDWK